MFKRFLELYYVWLEDESKGNTVFHIMNSAKYRDVDETLDPFIRLFKQELLPYFPENSELDLVKILKGAREFYVKKGSEESVKWLFRVLFGQDVEVYYPKKQILIASDGKWKLPQAFQLTLSDANLSINPLLLKKHKGTGSVSKATAIIESANKTVDRTFGNEILELYVSNVFREFTSGENLEIPYTDENGVEQLFVERIIGSISSIQVDATYAADPRRGLSYNVGDPVIVFGGLASTAQANDAVGVVGNVTQGSVESLTVAFPGYGYRTYYNTEAIVYRSVGDDPNANLSTDVRVTGITTANSTLATNDRFVESIIVDKMPILYMEAQTISNTGDWTLFSTNNRNMSITLNGTPGSGAAKWERYEDFYADSNGSYETANITGKILTSNASWTGAAATVTLYGVSNTHLNDKPLTILTGNLITTVNSSRNYTVDAILNSQLAINANSTIAQALNFELIETGGVALYSILNGGYGFQTTPTVGTESYHDTYLSEGYTYGTSDYANTRQLMGATGQIAHVYINNGGDGYANGDAIVAIGSGYAFTGYVNVGAGGTIVATHITNRGEGYYGAITANVTSSGGANAVLTPYGFGDSVQVVVANSAIGRVRDVRMVSRGFDYIETPNVSFKVVDIVIDGIDDLESLPEGERVFQGATLETASFQGIIKDYNRSTKLLRLYNYSGNSFTNFNSTLIFTSEGGVNFNVNTAATVTAPEGYAVSTLPNPWFYGNGKARGYAEFYNGLIKYTGFYLNTDGFLSSDKKLQDDKVYHNYSYVIESEKSLAEYQNSMKDIVHPIGTVMLGRTISKSELKENMTSTGVVYSVPAVNANATISVSNSYSVTITGANSLFNVTANVGDMVSYIDANNSLRSFTKLVTVVNSASSLNVESNFIYIGQGRIVTNAGNNIVYVSGNTNAVSDFIATGDVIRFNVGNVELYSVTVGTGNTLTLNNTANTSNTNLVYQVVPDYTGELAYEITKVTE